MGGEAGQMPTTNGQHTLQTRGSPQQHEARQTLTDLFARSPLPREQLLVNLGLYMRSSVLAKVLYVDELYQKILPIPGVIFEFGVWWGQNLALFESLRAIHEPYNHSRKVVGFDTFTGYPAIGAADGISSVAQVGTYGVAPEYDRYLGELLDYHQRENVTGHIKKYEIVKGDVTETIDAYLQAHPETIIALAYFDLQLYEPTKKCLEAIRPHLTRGSVVALDELNCSEFPGETQALREAWGLDRYRLTRSRFLPDRTFLTID
jgi:predicted O-methyltransferase YrrM